MTRRHLQYFFQHRTVFVLFRTSVGILLRLLYYLLELSSFFDNPSVLVVKMLGRLLIEQRRYRVSFATLCMAAYLLPDLLSMIFP